MARSITSTRLQVCMLEARHTYPPAISSRDLAVYTVQQVQLPKRGGNLACQLYAWILVYTPYFVLDHTKFKRIISDSFLICETCKWALNIYYLYTQERVTRTGRELRLRPGHASGASGAQSLAGTGWSDGQMFGLFRRKSTKGKYKNEETWVRLVGLRCWSVKGWIRRSRSASLTK